MIKKEFLCRRLALLEKMESSSIILIFSAPVAIRNNDNPYPYRQNSDFWYLTGFNEPEAMFGLIKDSDNCCKSLLFNRSHNRKAQIWGQNYIGQESARIKLAVDYAFPWEQIDNHLHLFLDGLKIIYHVEKQYYFSDRIIFTALEKLRINQKKTLSVPQILLDWRPLVHELRLIKSSSEITLLRQSGLISALGHMRALKKLFHGIHEYQIEGEIQYEFNHHGARWSAYNTIIASGENSCILHYTDNNKIIKNGQLVLIDAGCEFQGYASDISRTFPVNGKFNIPQRFIYTTVLNAFNLALKLYQPGTNIYTVTKKIIAFLVHKLVQLKIMQGDVQKLIKDKAIEQFFMHKLSHWIGLDVHDSYYYSQDDKRILEPGMVLTIEPGLYITTDSKVPSEYRGIGVRIEDTILITKNGNENLTSIAIKKINEIESFMVNRKSL
ncbi:Xaa-Pro aminopeptidase [Candidatus Erwinia haradaeae]|uniref:Xaa-Pro aminopeptidase n=1 Tax=Candidatus Erwinia haradaeae TaxID=1922217 RepID=A0A451D0A6_9GAMM|nr:Xaa-Pro aminopeptidase [Candidatus Erwinia haradaeae]VFP78983.1 Xaa-Pro aminopeptidase [Candidatus Erwinia haradaeae]